MDTMTHSIWLVSLLCFLFCYNIRSVLVCTQSAHIHFSVFFEFCLEILDVIYLILLFLWLLLVRLYLSSAIVENDSKTSQKRLPSFKLSTIINCEMMYGKLQKLVLNKLLSMDGIWWYGSSALMTGHACHYSFFIIDITL